MAILLATFNGEQYLQEQLDSIENQTHTNWFLCISDDGSTDETLSIIKKFADKHPTRSALKLRRENSTGRGLENFFSLLFDRTIDADFFAFCDQDDIWYPSRLAMGLEHLLTYPQDWPSLYGTRTEIIDKDNQTLGHSPLFTKKPNFSNALVQTIAGGNTMLFNKAAREFLLKSEKKRSVIPFHDWWAYLVISGCGGIVYYDPRPSLKYRQHSNNRTGSNLKLLAKIRRLYLFLNGEFRSWNEQHMMALEEYRECFTPKNQTILNRFKKGRTASFFERSFQMFKAKIHRQSLLENIALVLGVFLKKI